MYVGRARKWVEWVHKIFHPPKLQKFLKVLIMVDNDDDRDSVFFFFYLRSQKRKKTKRKETTKSMEAYKVLIAVISITALSSFTHGAPSYGTASTAQVLINYVIPLTIKSAIQEVWIKFCCFFLSQWHLFHVLIEFSVKQLISDELIIWFIYLLT